MHPISSNNTVQSETTDPRGRLVLRMWLRALRSPAHFIELPQSAWRWMLLYVLAGAGLIALGLTVWALVEDSLHEAVAGYVIPGSWPSILRWVFGRLMVGQTQTLTVNALVSAMGLCASLLFFRLKGNISARYETERQLVPDAPNPLPLRAEVWDEAKLAMAFITVQGGLFWLGYFDVPALKLTAAALSYIVLFGTWSINFVAPLFLRHGGHYSRTARVLAAHPLTALTFGAIYAMPVVLAGFLWKAHPEWDRRTAVSALFGVTLLCTAWAQAGGTYLAAGLYPRFTVTPRVPGWARAIVWLALGAVFTVSAWLYGSVAMSIHHKSQLLKCDWSVDLASTRVDMPQLGDILQERMSFGASVNVRVRNPTPFDVDVEDNRIDIEHGRELVGSTRITPFRVPAGAIGETPIGFRVSVDPSFVLKGRELFKSGWRITLYVNVGRGFELPVYLLR